MMKILISFILVFAPSQGNPKVNRIFVATPYNASIIFEYANASIPQDQQLQDGAVNCLVSNLMATGLFTDVRVIEKPIDAQRVNVDIEPDWHPSREKFVIEEIVFDGFYSLDQQKLTRTLQQRGFGVGIPLLSYPLTKIKELVNNTIEDVSQSVPQMGNPPDEISDLSLRIVYLAPEKVRLIIASGRRKLCN